MGTVASLCCEEVGDEIVKFGVVKFGNVKNKQLIEIWQDGKLTEFRNKLKNGDRSLSPCSNCNANGQVFGHNHAKSWK